MNEKQLTLAFLAAGVGMGTLERTKSGLLFATNEDGCLIWNGGGHQIRWNGRRHNIQRLAWELANDRQADPAKTIWHRCSLWQCCQPEHMEMITDRQRGRRSRVIYSQEVYAHAPQMHCSKCGSAEGGMSIQFQGYGKPLWQFRCGDCARAYDSATYMGIKAGKRPFHGRTKLLITDPEVIELIQAERGLHRER